MHKNNKLLFKKELTTFQTIYENKSDTILHYKCILHNIDGPAIIRINGDHIWYKDGEIHRENGPAMITNNKEVWYKNGLLHREDGPAMILKHDNNKQSEFWYLNNVLHKIDGPAIKKYNTKTNTFIEEWWENGIKK